MKLGDDVSKLSLVWHVVLVCRDCLGMFEVESVLFQASKNRAILSAPSHCPRCDGQSHDDPQ